jgi:hypothetical protein
MHQLQTKKEGSQRQALDRAKTLKLSSVNENDTSSEDSGSYSSDSQDGDRKIRGVLGKRNRGRKENGLVTLTIKFIELLKSADN